MNGPSLSLPGNPAYPVRTAVAAIGAFAVCAFVAVHIPRALSFFPGVAGLLLWAVWPYAGGGTRPLCRFALIGALATVGLAALSAIWAIDPADALERAGKVAMVLVPGSLALAAATAVPRAELGRLWWVIPAAVAVAGVLLNFEYLFNMPIYRLVRGMDAATPLNKYELNRAAVSVALLSIPCIGIVFARLRQNGQPLMRTVLLSALYGALFVPALLMTESQSAQMSFVTGLFVLALLPASSPWVWRGLMALLCAGILGAPFWAQLLFGMVPPPDAVASGGSAWLMRANTFARLEIWDFVSRYALQRPLTGFGIDATRMVEAFDNKELYQPGLTVLHPHNGAVQIWIEFGLIGALAACAGLYALLKRIASAGTAWARRTAAASFLAALVVALTGYGLWQGWWLGLLLLLATVTVLGTRAAQEPPPV